MNELILLALIVAGSVGAFFAGRLPMSGGAALGLALVPIAGMFCTVAFC
jgi:hypothetical protein